MIRKSTSKFRERVNLIFGLLIVVFIVLLIRIFGLQIIQKKTYTKLAQENIIKVNRITQNRGEFLDRNGIVIAANVPDYILQIHPYLVKNREYTIELLSELSKIPEKEIIEKLKSSQSYYKPVSIKKHLKFSEISKILENITELPGIDVEKKPFRDYKYGDITSLILGYTGEITESELKIRSELESGDIVGKTGLEKLYDKLIRGKPGIEYIEVDAKGREIGQIEQMKKIEPEAGARVHLTIDIELQILADSLLKEYEFGSVIAVKPKTGEVLVMYSKPGFDPNKLVRGISYDELKDMVVVEGASFWNRAAMSKYAPGSVFKIIIAGIALENNIINENTYLKPCNGWLRIGNRIFRCWKEHGRVDTYKAIVQSCDVFFYQVGMRLGFGTMEKWIRNLEIMEKTNIDLPEEGEGFFPDKAWYKEKYDLYKPTPGVVANLSIGQGEVLFTPLQLCCFFSGIANGGYTFSPYLVSEIKEVSGNVLYTHKREKKKIKFSQETIEFLKKAMLGVVNDRGGTGVLSRLSQCKVAGKTGTAENPQGEDHAWFVAFAPYEKPEICVVVQIENAGHGGSIAAPIAKEIIKKALGKDK